MSSQRSSLAIYASILNSCSDLFGIHLKLSQISVIFVSLEIKGKSENHVKSLIYRFACSSWPFLIPLPHIFSINISVKSTVRLVLYVRPIHWITTIFEMDNRIYRLYMCCFLHWLRISRLHLLHIAEQVPPPYVGLACVAREMDIYSNFCCVRVLMNLF